MNYISSVVSSLAGQPGSWKEACRAKRYPSAVTLSSGPCRKKLWVSVQSKRQGRPLYTATDFSLVSQPIAGSLETVYQTSYISVSKS